MFKDLGRVLDKKVNSLKKNQNKSNLTKNIFFLFLENEFGKDLDGFSFDLSYGSKEDSLIITTNNKTIANELTLKLDKLNSFFRENQISLNQILIR